MRFILDWSTSRPLHNGRRPLVAAVPSPTGIGKYDAATREIWQPDAAAVRAAIPAVWRAAFDRVGHGFWFDKHNNDAVPYLDLRDRRGAFLARIYAFPTSAPPVYGPTRNERAARAVSAAAAQLESFLELNPSRRAAAFIRVRYSGRQYVAAAGYSSNQGTSTVAVAFG